MTLLAEKLINGIIEGYAWKQTAKGEYELLGGDIKLAHRGKKWFLVVKDVGEVKLGKKASFTTADKALDHLLRKDQ